MNALPCDTPSFEGHKEDSLVYSSHNFPVKVPFGLPQGWSAFGLFMTPQSLISFLVNVMSSLETGFHMP